ncbi:GntR family transcriptional regulator [Metabacillus litoralis]|uniref:GntR family transcriptional regulator n=1 Tax=Metabacillus litoralis TaxID=152268 RepID=UPI00203A78D5|nr:GntR family transcriptional regulator [Metabacillus litoralis]MCM3652595.1 GntR family transcriptional regulator [Metabacillus litoralis]
MSFISSISTSKNLGEQAYETLRDSIITLQLEPGLTIFESEIAASLNISRTPIRDAFQFLISEGLIEVLPQRTKRIASISESKVKESGFVRLSLESSAFKLVARNWGDSEQHNIAEKQINRILHEQSEAAEQQDVVQFLQLDEAFHRCILQLAGNKTLLGVVYHMRGHLDRFRYLAMKELVLTKNLIHEHEELFASLKRQDEGKVEQLLEHHLGKFDLEIPRLREAFPDYFSD